MPKEGWGLVALSHPENSTRKRVFFFMMPFLFLMSWRVSYFICHDTFDPVQQYSSTLVIMTSHDCRRSFRCVLSIGLLVYRSIGLLVYALMGGKNDPWTSVVHVRHLAASAVFVW